ncbi:hypothetical protein QTG54_002522 [Skeletonema marinoi]|uniref:Uncharacterized protein n=1 Tax=Skeletonema marinoi TaxID=267567 RepID=A0AAD9DIV6_9STRA|nr:hypothetical protein QTG54_002522 [Skeletonema marinoi]
MKGGGGGGPSSKKSSSNNPPKQPSSSTTNTTESTTTEEEQSSSWWEDQSYYTTLTTLLDTGLYKAYQAELVPTVSAASQLLQLYIEMKESAALVLRECRWSVGVPLSGGLVVTTATTNNGSGGGGSRLRKMIMGKDDNDGYKIAIGGGSQNVFLVEELWWMKWGRIFI